MTFQNILSTDTYIGIIETMKTPLRLLVFTDLDGTLIDHDTYDWAPALPAIDALKKLGAGVILASSKTSHEIKVLRDALGLQPWPAIVENGAGVLPAHATPQDQSDDYTRLRAILTDLPKTLRDQFVGFGDMTIDALCKHTGLDTNAARLAQKRAYSEPGLWRGTPAQQADFIALLASNGIKTQQGGRFLSLSFGATKADQMRKIIQTYHPETTVALGDAPNDIEMLTASDFGVIVANPSKIALPALAGEGTGRIIRTQMAGPAGWNAAILELLTHLELNKD